MRWGSDYKALNKINSLEGGNPLEEEAFQRCVNLLDAQKQWKGLA